MKNYVTIDGVGILTFHSLFLFGFSWVGLLFMCGEVVGGNRRHRCEYLGKILL